MLLDACVNLHERKPVFQPHQDLRKNGPTVDEHYAAMTFARLCALSVVHSPGVDEENLNIGYLSAFLVLLSSLE